MTRRDAFDGWIADLEYGPDDVSEEAANQLLAAVPRVEPGADFVARTIVRLRRTQTRARRVTLLARLAAAVALVTGTALGIRAAGPTVIGAIKISASLISWTTTGFVAYSTTAIGLWGLVERIARPVATAAGGVSPAAVLVGVEGAAILAFFAMRHVVRFKSREGVRS